MSGDCRREPTSRALLAWSSVLAVVAHPDDESFGLGAVLEHSSGAGTRISVLCLTHGEASTVHGVAGNLAEVRVRELAAAARILGVADLTPRDYPDGALDQYVAAARSAKLIEGVGADGLLAFDPSGVTGHRDHAAASAAALLAAADLHLPVLGWTPARLGCHAAQSGIR